MIVAISLSFPKVKPDTVTISADKVEPVETKLVVRLEISESLLVICVCKVCPLVIRLLLMVSVVAVSV